MPGLADVLSSRGRRAHWVAAPGSLVVSALRWSGIDRWTQAWWPQGIAVGSFGGASIVLVSWFSKRKHGGARITVLDLDTLRYHHVALVEGPERKPVAVHAGGIVWTGDRLLVAATMGGIREFRMSSIERVSRRHAGRFHAGRLQYVLPQLAALDPAEKFRYSFLAEGSDGIVAGEFRKDHGGRLAQLALSAGAVAAGGIHTPGVPEMQGALLIDGVWAISSSRGDRRNGDLWTGKRGALVRHEGALPPGPEDLAWWPEHRQIWGATEHPGARFVYAIELPV